MSQSLLILGDPGTCHLCITLGSSSELTMGWHPTSITERSYSGTHVLVQQGFLFLAQGVEAGRLRRLGWLATGPHAGRLRTRLFPALGTAACESFAVTLDLGFRDRVDLLADLDQDFAGADHR